MISGSPLPLFLVSTMSASAAAMCGHVCVTARLLPNVRCKFLLSRLTRSAPTFRRIPARRGIATRERKRERKREGEKDEKNVRRQSLATRTLNISDDIVDYFSNGFKSESFFSPRPTSPLSTRSDRLIRSQEKERERKGHLVAFVLSWIICHDFQYGAFINP